MNALLKKAAYGVAAGLLLAIGVVTSTDVFAQSASTPTVTGVSPSIGYVSGGDTVTISGSNFEENTIVSFGPNPATTIWINSNTLTATSPAGYAGVVDLSVTNPDGGYASIASAYTYREPAPTFTAIDPNVGPSAGGQTVTITGSNFSDNLKSVTTISPFTTTTGASTCALYNQSNVQCWGYNGNGLGRPNTNGGTTTVPTPIDMTGVLAGKTIKALDTGSLTACVIASDNLPYCWGRGSNGAMGNNSTNGSQVPVAVDASGVLAGKRLSKVAVGDQIGCALSTEGKVYCWGLNNFGQLGINSTATNSLVPVAVDTSGVLAGKTIVDLSVGTAHVCVVSSEGAGYCWGRGTNGRLGNGATATSLVPAAVTTSGVLAGKTLRSIDAADDYTCASATDETAYCWGNGANGRLGNGTTASSSVPISVNTTGALTGKTIRSIATGFAHTCVTASDDQAYCWGSDTDGALGNGTSFNASVTPTAVDTGGVLAGKTVRSINVGYNTGCVVASDGQGYCWGKNNYAAGDGSSLTRQSPVAVIPWKGSAPQVSFDGINGTSTTLLSRTALQTVTPAHTQGSVPIRIQNYDGQSASQADAYQYADGPTASTISPNKGSLNGGTDITITGSGFYGSMQVSIGGVAATNVQVVNSSTLTARTASSATPGLKNVVVADQYNQTATITNGFTYELPTFTITEVNPKHSTSGTPTTVTVKGSGFVDWGQGASWYTVSFGNANGTSVTYIDESTLTVQTPNRSPGTFDVTISTTNGQSATLEKSFTFLANSYRFNNNPLTLSAGQEGQLIAASRGTNGPTTSQTDTLITLSSSSPTGQFAINLNEDESTRWGHTSVILPAGASTVPIWYRDSTPGTPTITGIVGDNFTSFTQQQTMLSRYRLQVTGISDPITSGTPSSVTVRAIDYTGAAAPNYSGTFSFSSSDSAADLPAQYTMTTADRGIKTFTNGVTMKTSGEFCVTATDVSDSVITGVQCDISVRSANTGSIDRLAVITQSQSIPLNTTSAPITIQTRNATDAIPVNVATPLYISSDSASMQFSQNGIDWASGPFTATVSAGSSSTNVYVRDSVNRTSTIFMRDLSTDTGNQDLGWTNTSQTIRTGTGAAARLSVDGPSSLITGQKGSYTLRLVDSNGVAVTALQDYAISLSSTTSTTLFYTNGNSTGLAGPLQLTIPTGTSTLTFEASDTTVSIGSAMTYLRAVDTANALITGEREVQILSSSPTTSRLSLDNSTIESGIPTQVTLQLLGENNEQTYASQNTLFSLASSSPNGSYSLTADPFTPIGAVTLARGEGTKTLFYRDTRAGTAQLRAQSQGLSSTQTPVTVNASDAYRIGVTPSSRTAELNTASSAYTVTIYDTYGNIVISETPRTLYVSSNEASVGFALTSTGPWNTATITIPAGETSVNFYARGSAFIDSPATLTVSDEALSGSPDENLVNDSSQLTITSQAVHSIEFTSQPRTLLAGTSSDTISVALKRADGSPALQNGTTAIALSTSEGKFTSTNNPTAPALGSITVGKNQSSATVYYTAEKSGTHTISVQQGSANTSQQITVNAATPSILAFTSPEQTLVAGQISEAISVQLLDSFGNLASPDSPLSLTLASSCDGQFSKSASDWQETTTLTINQQVSQASFYFRSSSAGDCTISVSAANITSASQTVTITSSGPVRLVVRGPTILERAQNGTYSVDIVNEAGDVTAPSRNTTITVSSNTTTGTFSRTTLVFEAGQSTQTFTYSDTTAGVVTLQAVDQRAELSADTHTITINDGAATQVRLSPVNSTIRADQHATLTVSLLNAHGAVIPAASDTTISLQSDVQSGVFLDENDTPVTSLVIPQRVASKTFHYSQRVASTAIVQARSLALTSSSASVTVLPTSISAITYTSPAHSGNNALEIGETGTFEVTLTDQYGNHVTTPSALTLYARSNASGVISNNGQFTIAAGQSSGRFTYTQQERGSFTISVSDQASGGSTALGPISQNGEVIYGAPAELQFASASSVVERGGVSAQQTVQLLNAHGFAVPAPSNGQQVRLAVSLGTGAFSTTPNGTFTEELLITIPEGESQSSFYYRNDNASIEDRECRTVNGARQCQTTKTYPHSIAAQALLANTTKVTTKQMTMIYGDPVRYSIITPPRQQQANKPTQLITIERQNRYGKAVPLHKNSALTVETSAEETGKIGASKTQWTTNQLTILDSDATVSFYYKDSQEGTPQLSILPAPEDQALVGDRQRVTITQATEPPAPAVGFLVTNISDPQQQGTPSSVVVVAIDAEGFIVEGYAGTIKFSSDDSNALLPTQYTFNPEIDRGWKTFTNQVAFRSPGEKTVTVRDENDLTGSQTDITVLGSVNTPVRAVAFTSPSSPHTLSPNTTTLLLIELFDGNGDRTVAPIGGLAIRLTSEAAGGRFDSDSTRIITIPEGIGFATATYQTAAPTNHRISVSDWQGGVDSTTITNGSLAIRMTDTPVQPEVPEIPSQPEAPSTVGPQPTSLAFTQPSENGASEQDTPDEATTPKPEGPDNATDPVKPQTQDDIRQPEVSGSAAVASVVIGSLILIIPLISESIRHVRVVHKLQDIAALRHIPLTPGTLLSQLKMSPFASVYFWLPIVGAIALSIAATVVAREAATGAISVPVVVTSIVLIIVLDITFIVVHSKFLGRIKAALR